MCFWKLTQVLKQQTCWWQKHLCPFGSSRSNLDYHPQTVLCICRSETSYSPLVIFLMINMSGVPLKTSYQFYTLNKNVHVHILLKFAIARSIQLIKSPVHGTRSLKFNLMLAVLGKSVDLFFEWETVVLYVRTFLGWALTFLFWHNVILLCIGHPLYLWYLYICACLDVCRMYRPGLSGYTPDDGWVQLQPCLSLNGKSSVESRWICKLGSISNCFKCKWA